MCRWISCTIYQNRHHPIRYLWKYISYGTYTFEIYETYWFIVRYYIIMIVKAPHSFIKWFQKDYRLYDISMADLASKLIQMPMIKIKYPIVKCKFYLKNIAMRWFCIVKNDTIIPLYMVIKNSRLWDNLILDKTMSKKLDNLMSVYTQEIISGLYDTYDI